MRAAPIEVSADVFLFFLALTAFFIVFVVWVVEQLAVPNLPDTPRWPDNRRSLGIGGNVLFDLPFVIIGEQGVRGSLERPEPDEMDIDYRASHLL